MDVNSREIIRRGVDIRNQDNRFVFRQSSWRKLKMEKRDALGCIAWKNFAAEEGEKKKETWTKRRKAGSEPEETGIFLGGKKAEGRKLGRKKWRSKETRRFIGYKRDCGKLAEFYEDIF